MGRELEALFAGSRDGDLVALLLERVLDASRDGEPTDATPGPAGGLTTGL